MRIIVLSFIVSLLSSVITQTSSAQSKPTIVSAIKKSYNGSDISCASQNDGAITVTAAGGSGNYVYSKNNGETFQDSNIFTNLASSSNYVMVVCDRNNKDSKSDAVWVWVGTVNPVTVSSLNVNKNASCFSAADGQVDITAWGGSGALQFSIDNGVTFQPSGNFPGLRAGTYRIIVKDLNGCSATSATATVMEPVAITASIISIQNASCSVTSGSVTIKGNGSTGDYSASIDGGSFNWFSRSNSYTFNNLAAGTHTILIEDNYTHCTGQLTFTTGVFTASISGNNTACSGSTSGFNVSISEGNGTSFTATYKDNAGKTFVANNLSVGDNFITTGALTASATFTLVSVKNNSNCSAMISGTASIQVSSPGTWLGANSNWNDAANWSCGVIPCAGSNVTIPETSNNPVINPFINGAAIAVKNITINKGAGLMVNGTLQLSGSITNNGNLDVIRGTLEMKGTSAQTISGNTFESRTIRNLKISNTAGVNLSSITNDTLNITGLLSFGVSNATFDTKDNLTLKSTAVGTAAVADLTNNGVNNGNAIVGKVVVERYIHIGSGEGQHNKSWVMVSTPTQGQTIKESWMENGIKSVTGYGTQITGKGVGFDVASGTPSLKYYDAAKGSWVGITNTNDSIYNQSGYMLFVRGDRSATFPNYNNTTLRTKGTLLTGTQPTINVKAGSFTSVGNPYPSDIDIRKFINGGITPDIIIWDATLTIGSSFGLGAYQVLYKMGNNYYNLLSSPAYGRAGTLNNYIKSGLSFFVQAYNNDEQLTFNENSKSSKASAGIALKVSTEDDGVSLATNLLGVKAGGSTFVVDGTIQQFSDIYSNGVDNMDSKKISNTSENLSIKIGANTLTSERRNMITSVDTIFYNLTGLVNQNYRFELEATGLKGAGLEGFITDSYSNTSTSLNPEGVTTFDFKVTSAAETRVANRFKIIFKNAFVLPVSIASVKATQKNETVVVEWKVESQSNMSKYEIERSATGNQFTRIATIAANNNPAFTYNCIDGKPVSGYNYYRIRSVDINGKATYSQIVKVQIGESSASSISVYPNPAINAKVNVQLNNYPAGVYYVRLINPIGQVVVSKQIVHKEGGTSEIIKWSTNSARGTYHLEVTKPGCQPAVVTVLY